MAIHVLMLSSVCLYSNVHCMVWFEPLVWVILALTDSLAVSYYCSPA